jgi:predicted phosphodiesterase
MKLAVLSDIHSNYAALREVTEHIEAWGPDVIVVAGDLINRGPRPLECLRFVQEKQRSRGWRTLIGNHEEYVIKNATDGEPASGPQFEMRRSSYWTYEKLNRDVTALQAMPFKISLPAPDGTEIRLTHGSMRGTRVGVYWHTPDAELPELIGDPLPPLFCVGHTHMPLAVRSHGTLVVNAGSAGLPFDGDTRVSYAQMTLHKGRWDAKIVRLDYDRAQAERDFSESGFLDEGGPLAQLILTELRTAHSQLYQWNARYEKALLAREITMEQSVREFSRTNHDSHMYALGRYISYLPTPARRAIAIRLVAKRNWRAQSGD